MRKRKIVWILAAWCVVVIVSLGILADKWVKLWRLYGEVYVPGTYINSIDVSGQTAAQVCETLQEELPDRLFIKLKQDTVMVYPDEVGYQRVVPEDELKDILKGQDRMDALRGHDAYHYEVEVGYELDAEEMRRVIANMLSEVPQDMAEDAHIRKTEEGFAAVQEVLGTELKVDAILSVCEERWRAGEATVDCTDDKYYQQPEVYARDLEPEIERLNGMWQSEIVIDGLERVPEETVLSWLEADESWNEELIDEYIAYLDEAYSTMGRPRPFLAQNGTTVFVGGNSGDTYGSKLNQEETKNGLLGVLGQIWFANGPKMGYTVPVVWETGGYTASGNSDFGDTYLEISIEDQHMWYIKDGAVLVDTDVTTGLKDTGRDTPTGAYQVLYKLEDYTMRGSYGSAWANYVMPIDNRGICVHDAPWRSQYGGNVYTYDGSHGCINTPYDAMRAIYQDIEPGTPVVIY